MFPEVKLKVPGKKISVLEQWDCSNGPDCFIVLGIREAVRDNELYYALLSLLREQTHVCVHHVVNTHTHTALNAVICPTRRVAAALTFSLCWSCSAVWLHSASAAALPGLEIHYRYGICPGLGFWKHAMSCRWCYRAKQCCFCEEFCMGRESDVCGSAAKEFHNPSLPQRRIRWCRDARRAQAGLAQQWIIKARGVHRFYPPESHRDSLWCVQRERERAGLLFSLMKSVLVELRVDTEDGKTRTEYQKFSSCCWWCWVIMMLISHYITLGIVGNVTFKAWLHVGILNSSYFRKEEIDYCCDLQVCAHQLYHFQEQTVKLNFSPDLK